MSRLKQEKRTFLTARNPFLALLAGTLGQAPFLMTAPARILGFEGRSPLTALRLTVKTSIATYQDFAIVSVIGLILLLLLVAARRRERIQTAVLGVALAVALSVLALAFINIQVVSKLGVPFNCRWLY